LPKVSSIAIKFSDLQILIFLKQVEIKKPAPQGTGFHKHTSKNLKLKIKKENHN